MQISSSISAVIVAGICHSIAPSLRQRESYCNDIMQRQQEKKIFGVLMADVQSNVRYDVSNTVPITRYVFVWTADCSYSYSRYLPVTRLTTPLLCAAAAARSERAPKTKQFFFFALGFFVDVSHDAQTRDAACAQIEIIHPS